MKLSETEYFFYEWLIISKGMTQDRFNNLTEQEIDELKSEYSVLRCSDRCCCWECEKSIVHYKLFETGMDETAFCSLKNKGRTEQNDFAESN